MNRRARAVVFALACGLRLALSLVNSEANDDHMPVVYRILDTGRMPVRGECFECFQPKLYYALGAGILKAADVDIGRQSVVAMQLLSCAFGIGTLWAVHLLLGLWEAAGAKRLAAFSLVALNPHLIAISGQASNDAAVVCFSTFALYFLAVHLGEGGRGRGSLLRLTSCVTLACLAKGSGFVILMGTLLLLAARLALRWGEPKARASAASSILIFVLGWAAVAPYFGQYVHNYRTFGTPFVVNHDRQPLPHFFKDTFPPRPGITSVANSYLTFRFIQLMRLPMINIDYYRAPFHQTSFWTVLYGSAHCVNYYQWPRSWQSRAMSMIRLARAVLFFALLPTALLLWGFGSELAAAVAALRRRDLGHALSPGFSALMFSSAFVCFLIYYTALYRDFGTIKAIYIFPGIAAFLRLFLVGYERACARRRVRPWILGGIAALCVLYVADIGSVILRLAAF